MTVEAKQDIAHGSGFACLRQRLVDATIQVHGGVEGTQDVRPNDLIHLRQVLRELCLACGSWNRAVELVYQADIAALRKLGETESAPRGRRANEYFG